MSSPSMDEFELFQQLNQPIVPVKQEEPEGTDVQSSRSISEPASDDSPTGLSALQSDLQAAVRKEAEEAKRLADFMQREDKEPPAKKKRSSREDDRKASGETKAPLSTFGHSSRPRRSVNYASIERGDEAQAQSLVTDFHTGKKKQKRTRDDLDENYVEETASTNRKKKSSARPGRPSNYGLATNATQFAAKAFIEVKKAEDEFKACIPRVADQRPEIEKRAIGTTLDQMPAIRRASGGFRKFCAWLNDEQILKIIQAVDRRCIVDPDKNLSQDRILLRSIRHVYNSMPKGYRRDWEYAAKMDVFESRFFVQNMTMPLSEIMVKDSAQLPLERKRQLAGEKVVRANCCSMQPYLTSMSETLDHYLSHHDVVYLFGCDICCQVYPTRYELTKHECKEFTEYMIELLCKEKTLELEAAYMYLCCSQCGLWLSVKTSSQALKGWLYFLTALRDHSCQPLVPIIVYFRKALKDEGKNIRMKFQMMFESNVSIPISCSDCEIDEFKTVVEIENHFKVKHGAKHTCAKCGRSFGTEFMMKQHFQTHYTQTVQFGNYLTYTATYQPPPSSGREAHIGFNSEIPIVGGMTAGEYKTLAAFEKKSEFVELNEDTFRKKVFRWRRPKNSKKENRKTPGKKETKFVYESGDSSGEEEFQKRMRELEQESSASSTESDSSDEVTSNRKKKKRVVLTRGDLGYEHIDRSDLSKRSETEEEARKRIETIMKKRLFLSREKLLDPEYVLKSLNNSQAAYLEPIRCSLADDIVASCMRTIELPASNCVDPHRDLLLINRVFYYCPKCKTIISKDPATHTAFCDVQEDDIIELFHAAQGAHSGVRCVVPGCNTHICSIISLRSHTNDVHNFHMNLESQSNDLDPFHETRYDKSLMNMTRCLPLILADERSLQARMTDIDCYLPFSGLLEGKLQPRTTMPVMSNRQSVQNVRIAESVPMRTGQLALEQNPQQQQQRNLPHVVAPDGRSLNRVKPYKIPRTSRWYSCTWCDREYEHLGQFTEHLTCIHAHPCSMCGKAFSSQNTKRTHVCIRGFSDQRAPGTALCGQCHSCSEIHPIETLFSHMLGRHFSTMEYIQATGELIPPARDLAIRKHNIGMLNIQYARYGGGQRLYDGPRHFSQGADVTSEEYRLKIIKTGLKPVIGTNLNELPASNPPIGSFTLCPPHPNNIDPRLMCYMCELTFDSNEELNVHMMDDHAEQWSTCPFCGFCTLTHYDLQKHLLQAHVIKISGTKCCSFCLEPHGRYMCSHMLFRCRKVSKCTICGQKSNGPNANRTHMQRCHSLTIKRFQCTYCSTGFISVGEYYDHECTGGRIFVCSCAPNKFFNSASSFCDHYDSMHILNNRCKLCAQEFSTEDGIAMHRSTHMHSRSVKETQRKLYILMKNLFPKPHSGYMRWIEGGSAPPSYEDIDRRHMEDLMGDNGSIASLTHKSYSVAPKTLFDVLEGPSAQTTFNGNHRTVTLAPRPVATTSSVSNNDIILLSDDENDEDCVVFEKSVANGVNNKVTINGAAATDDQVNREVRVEQSQSGYGGAQQPGYVADDDTEQGVEGTTSPSREPIIKNVVDENGDDELSVVAEVANATGTLPSSISAARAKKFKCSKCSLSFYTNSSLQSHAKEHRQDAGNQASTETFGIPIDTKTAFLCRNCCVVFEDCEKYKAHMAIHGDTCLTCPYCSGIAFNHTAIGNHMKSHEDRKVRYACGTCLLNFNSDLALLFHLNAAHDTSLFYFCKVCGSGSTNADIVFQHLSIHHNNSYTLSQRFGACPVQLLNYDPADELTFCAKVLAKVIKLHEPSDCSHRSMLLQQDTVVSCKTCHCTQSWFSYMAFNGHSEETGFPTFSNMDPPQDYRKEFALARHLTDKNAQSMARYGNMNPASEAGRRSTYHPRQPNAYRPVIEPSQRITSKPPKGSSPVITVTQNGARVILPATPANPKVTPRQTQQLGQSHPLIQQGIRRVVMTRPPTGSGSPTPPVVAPSTNSLQVMRPHIAVSTNCRFKDCEKPLYSEFDRHLHFMHHSDNAWFCRQCGHSPKSEIDLFLHYIREHLTPAFVKHHAAGFKPNVFQLRCPIPTCVTGDFQSPKNFEKHMRIAHAEELPYEATCCDTRFASQELCDKHDRQHMEYQKTNGTDASCCPICGTLDMWSLPKDQKTDCLQSHIIRHGLDYRSSCRWCLKQFPADSSNAEVIQHIKEAHGLAHTSGAITCKLCVQSGFNNEQFAEHCREKHIFHLLVKSSLSARGELVVSTGQEYQKYVGLKLAGRPRDDHSYVKNPNKGRNGAKSTAASPNPTAVSGNAALLTIAAAIPDSGSEENGSNSGDTAVSEVLTLD